jgi:hypothetical protein
LQMGGGSGGGLHQHSRGLGSCEALHGSGVAAGRRVEAIAAAKGNAGTAEIRRGDCGTPWVGCGNASSRGGG